MVDAAPGPAPRRHLLLLACFFLSGLAALIYQTAWTRQLALVFGSSELAVATVLAAYMGGFAAGAAVAGRIAQRALRPVLWYGMLELGIALGALALPLGLRAANAVHVALYGGMPSPPDHGGLGSALFYLAATFTLLLPPTALMGATLPLLARHAVESDSQLGGRIAQLYAVNTFGALVGTLITAFALLPWFGVSSTVLIAVCANVAVFVAAAALARAAPIRAARDAALAPLARRTLRGGAWIRPAIALSGMVSFTYEVLWSRLLVQVLGGSVDAFAAMLASFLLGIAIGSLLAARSATDPRRAAETFGFAQLTIAVLAIASLRLVDSLPGVMDMLSASGGSRLALDAVAAIAILLPLTIGIGATFPLAVRVLARDETEAASATASIYAWNTVGAVLGAVGTGFFVLPWLGFAGVVAAAVAVHLLLALAASELGSGGVRSLRIGVGVVAALLLFLPPTTPEYLLRSSPLLLAPSTGGIEYLEVGRSATVMVLADQGSYLMRTNGLPESQVAPTGARITRSAVGLWLSSLPSLLRPEAETMMVVGMGGGTALEFLPSNLRQVDVVELEPAVVRANEKLSGKRSRDPLADPRVNVVVNDARSALALTSRKYDAIVSQPSHPWTAGSSNLYTREFMILLRDHLEPSGILVQWMGVPFVDEPLLEALLATVQDVFPYVVVFQPTSASVLFAASDAPIPVHENVKRALAVRGNEYAEVGFLTPEDVVAHYLLDADAAKQAARGGEIIRDDRNLLEMRSPAVVRSRSADDEPARVFPGRDALATLPEGLSRPWIAWRLTASGMRGRAEELAAAAPSSGERDLARAVVLLAAGRSGSARKAFERAGLAMPGDPRARHGLALVATTRPKSDGDPELLALERGRAALRARDKGALRAIDAELAQIRPPSLLFQRASRLRARARLLPSEGSRPSQAEAKEALRILDRIMPMSTKPEDLVLRAGAAVAAGSPEGAVRDLYDVVLAAPQRGEIPLGLQPVLRRAAALAAAMPPERVGADVRADLVARLNGLTGDAAGRP